MIDTTSNVHGQKVRCQVVQRAIPGFCRDDQLKTSYASSMLILVVIAIVLDHYKHQIWNHVSVEQITSPSLNHFGLGLSNNG